MYITLPDNSPDSIVKETYFDGSYWFDNMGSESCSSIGSVGEQLPLKIKGRGNYSFYYYDKKPFRIKLDTKASLGGLPKSKHFCMLSDTENTNIFNLRDPMGFRIAEMIGMDWSPSCIPVELVINGNYRGIYFLTEKIRIDSDRVNITEQEDMATEDVTGGWLCELDNYVDEESFQYVMSEKNTGRPIRITVHSPEILSSEQKKYITAELDTLNALIGESDRLSDEIWNKVDIESLAKYYVVSEVMNRYDAFQGSCYFYKDRGEESKWHWGPVWDMDCTKDDPDTHFYELDGIIDEWIRDIDLWVRDLDRFPAFRKEVARQYEIFRQAGGYESVVAYAEDFITRTRTAHERNNQRWPQYAESSEYPLNWYMNKFKERSRWLDTYFSETKETTGMVVNADAGVADIKINGCSTRRAEVFAGSEIELGIELKYLYELDSVRINGNDVTPSVSKDGILKFNIGDDEANIDIVTKDKESGICDISGTDILISSDNGFVNIDSQDAGVKFCIYNIVGEIVAKGTAPAKVGPFSRGIYFVVTPAVRVKLPL